MGFTNKRRLAENSARDEGMHSGLKLFPGVTGQALTMSTRRPISLILPEFR